MNRLKKDTHLTPNVLRKKHIKKKQLVVLVVVLVVLVVILVAFKLVVRVVASHYCDY